MRPVAFKICGSMMNNNARAFVETLVRAFLNEVRRG